MVTLLWEEGKIGMYGGVNGGDETHGPSLVRRKLESF